MPPSHNTIVESDCMEALLLLLVRGCHCGGQNWGRPDWSHTTKLILHVENLNWKVDVEPRIGKQNSSKQKIGTKNGIFGICWSSRKVISLNEVIHDDSTAVSKLLHEFGSVNSTNYKLALLGLPLENSFMLFWYSWKLYHITSWEDLLTLSSLAKQVSTHFIFSSSVISLNLPISAAIVLIPMLKHSITFC